MIYKMFRWNRFRTSQFNVVFILEIVYLAVERHPSQSWGTSKSVHIYHILQRRPGSILLVSVTFTAKLNPPRWQCRKATSSCCTLMLLLHLAQIYYQKTNKGLSCALKGHCSHSEMGFSETKSGLRFSYSSFNFKYFTAAHANAI